MLLYPGKLSWIIVYIINVENVATEISKDYGRNVAVPQRAGMNNCLYGKFRECTVAAERSKYYGRNVAVPRKVGLDICLFGKCRECLLQR